MEVHKIERVKTLPQMIIDVYFCNGTKKRYDLKQLLKNFEIFKTLEDEEIFKTAKVDIGGYAIVWNSKIDLSGEEIWKNGIE